VKRGLCPPDLEARAIEVMSHLNRQAGEAMVAAGASAATDVTGYGLVGHLRNLRTGAEVRLGAVPVLDGVLELAAADLFPGGTRRNHQVVRDEVDWGGLAEPDQLLLCDAQTSGGLLVAIAPERVSAFEAGMAGSPYPAVRIGEVIDGPIRIRA
jgi:selenide,water dikinase